MKRRRLRPSTAFIGALLLLPASLSAQRASLRIASGDSSTTIAADQHRGYPAYPTAALAALGAEIESTPRGIRARLLNDTLTFEFLSPIFYAAAKPQQLAAPAYRRGDEVYIPGQLFTDWLPANKPELIRYDKGTLRLTKHPRERSGQEVGTKTGATDKTAPARAGTTANTHRPADRKQTGKTAPATRVVIIDPGHGGRDPGKIGPGGVREKDLTLAIARRLANTLRERRGFEVHLTRTTDTLIALADRPHLANRWKDNRPAALFISIHANSAANKNARGFETFFLSDARTEDERRVAEMENAAVAYETPPDKASATNDLDWIFNTLRNDFYVRASNDLAEVIQRRFTSFHPGPDRGVKQAGFRVLVGAFMPAVLVETAFISNNSDAALLKDASFQQKIASALANAVEEYFNTHEHLWNTEEARSGRGAPQ